MAEETDMYQTIRNRIEQMNRIQLLQLRWSSESAETILDTLVHYEDCNDDVDTEHLRQELLEEYCEAE